MRKKLRRFKDNVRNKIVVEPGKSVYETIKGKWLSNFFGNKNPIVLEIGCGRGEYTIGMAQHYPESNFIGIDIKGDRIWQGSSQAAQLNLENVAFLRTQIQQIGNFFEENEADEIWITFPDPRPKDRDEKRRLTYSRFIELYKKIMKPGGLIHLKTDNSGLFDYTMDSIQKRSDISELEFTRDLYQSELNLLHHEIRTKYEIKHSEMGEKIKYMRFRLDGY
jgi:tRNA (guanine-N7-)-methyltransferase